MSFVRLQKDYVASSQRSDQDESTEPANSLTPNILVVDDDPLVRNQLSRLYEERGFVVETVASAEEALTHLKQERTDIVVTDVELPHRSGIQLITNMQETHPDVPVIAVTARFDVETVVKAIKCGAVDFMVKPFDLASLLVATLMALEKNRTCMEIRRLRGVLKHGVEFGNMLSKTPEMHRLFEAIRTLAATDMAVVIEGETGTGKELVAGAIHRHSARRERPFVTVNCAGLPDSLLEQELWGFEKRGYNESLQAGKIELGNGGTLFLNEIESLSVAMQIKLLGVVEDRTVRRMGGYVGLPADLRVITAATTPLATLVAEGKMRPDFYYRINVVPIRLMPLRERYADIPLLVHDFLHRHPVAAQRRILSVSEQAMRSLLRYSWPGNIRELQNTLERAIIRTNGHVIEEIDLPDIAPDGIRPSLSPAKLSEWLRENEKHFIEKKLAACGGNIGLTARSCGIGLRSLYRKMQMYGLDKKQFRQNGAMNKKVEARRQPVAIHVTGT